MNRTLFAHEKHWEQLRRLHDKAQLSHAWLFTGPEGVGKKKLATMLAEVILCKDEADSTVFRSGNFPDFLLISGDGHIKVEAVREIQQFLAEKPLYSDKKVVIVDDAHQMGIQAQNKFLKTLEEPPRFSHLFLISDRPWQLLDTIRSRAMSLQFRPLSRREVYELLPTNYSAAARELAANFAQGSAQRALAILTDESMQAVFRQPAQIFSALIDADYEGMLSCLKEIGESREQAVKLLDYCELWLRDLSLVRENQESVNLSFLHLRRELLQQANYLSAEKMPALLQALEEARARIQANVNSSMSLYSLLLHWQEEITR